MDCGKFEQLLPSQDFKIAELDEIFLKQLEDGGVKGKCQWQTKYEFDTWKPLFVAQNQNACNDFVKSLSYFCVDVGEDGYCVFELYYYIEKKVMYAKTTDGCKAMDGGPGMPNWMVRDAKVVPKAKKMDCGKFFEQLLPSQDFKIAELDEAFLKQLEDSGAQGKCEWQTKVDKFTTWAPLYVAQNQNACNDTVQSLSYFCVDVGEHGYCVFELEYFIERMTMFAKTTDGCKEMDGGPGLPSWVVRSAKLVPKANKMDCGKFEQLLPSQDFKVAELDEVFLKQLEDSSAQCKCEWQTDQKFSTWAPLYVAQNQNACNDTVQSLSYFCVDVGEHGYCVFELQSFIEKIVMYAKTTDGCEAMDGGHGMPNWIAIDAKLVPK